jgi:hypothetical protein
MAFPALWFRGSVHVGTYFCLVRVGLLIAYIGIRDRMTMLNNRTKTKAAFRLGLQSAANWRGVLYLTRSAPTPVEI